MTDRNRFDLESSDRARGEVVAAANAVLCGHLGIIEGARRLSRLAHSLVDDWTSDPDFLVLGALDSETDHLPVGSARAHWAATALREKDAIIARIEAEARFDVEAACRGLIVRFQDV